MSTLTKPKQGIFLLSVTFFSIIFFSSCGNQARIDLTALEQLVPQDSLDKIAYLTEAVNTYNALQAATIDPNMIGRRISDTLSNTIIRGNDKGENATQAVLFSFSKIYESVRKIPLQNLSDAKLAIYFGRYPIYEDGQQISQEFLNAGISQNVYNTEYAGRRTVVLKYVPGEDSTQVIKKLNSSGQVIDNIGMLCPKNCPNQFLLEDQ